MQRLRISTLILLFLGIFLDSYAQDPIDKNGISKDQIEGTHEPPRLVNRYDVSFFRNPKLKKDARFELLSVGDIKPKGWLYDIMKQDITTGFVANLDKLAPDIMGDKPFSDRRKSLTDIPDVGDQVLTGEPWEISMQWWSGESLGQWWDGFVRTAYLTGDKVAIERSDKIVDYILSTQDKDGYIGIYSKNMRFQHEGSNGELWTQAALFRMLLAYYQMTKSSIVLEAVERAMTVTMTHYNDNARSPFKLTKASYGGVSHGLIMTDVCETLFRLTKKQKYQDYAVYLYKEYCVNPLNRSMNNVRYEYLMDKDILFESHSVHTYEHLRTLINAYYETGYPELEEAFESAMNKLSYAILPSGSGFGNEWMSREIALPDSTGAEHCGMFELREFYTSAVQKAGNVKYADQAEKITFNAMQGSRNSNGSAIVYCKTDNCYVLNNKAPQHGFKEHDFRYKYSPTHKDAAVCCNPSYAKNWPYYVGNMWMKAEDGLAAVLYGPSTITTNYNGVNLTINEQTNYPFSDDIEFEITADSAINMSIYLRKPNWSKELKIEISGAEISHEEGYYIINKTWRNGDTFNVSFINEIFPVKANNNEVALQRGSIVYALEIPHKEEIINTYDIQGFTDYLVYPTDKFYENMQLNSIENDSTYGFKYVVDENQYNPFSWYSDKSYLSGELYNSELKKNINVKLIPMGRTVLRRITFPIK